MKSWAHNELLFACKLAAIFMLTLSITLIARFDYEDMPQRLERVLSLRNYGVTPSFPLSQDQYLRYRGIVAEHLTSSVTEDVQRGRRITEFVFFLPPQWKADQEFLLMWGDPTQAEPQPLSGIIVSGGVRDLLGSSVLPFWELHSIQAFHLAYLLNNWWIRIMFIPGLVGAYLFVQDIYRLGRRVREHHKDAAQAPITSASVTPKPQSTPLSAETEEERALRAQEQEERRMQKLQSDITQYEQEIRTLLQALAVRTSIDSWQQELEDILQENRSPERKLRRLQYLHDKLSAAHPSPVP